MANWDWGSAGGNAAGGAASGALAGSVVPGIGTLAGAIVGGLGGLIKGGLTGGPGYMPTMNPIDVMGPTGPGVTGPPPSSPGLQMTGYGDPGPQLTGVGDGKGMMMNSAMGGGGPAMASDAPVSAPAPVPGTAMASAGISPAQGDDGGIGSWWGGLDGGAKAYLLTQGLGMLGNIYSHWQQNKERQSNADLLGPLLLGDRP